MDHPVIGPGNVQNNLQAQLSIRKIQGDFDAGKAPIPEPLGRSAVSPALKTHGVPVTGPTETHIERVLPLPILERPALVQTEWAWRRLLIQLLSSFAQTSPSESVMTVTQSVWSGQKARATEPEVITFQPETPVGEKPASETNPQVHKAVPQSDGAKPQVRANEPQSELSQPQTRATESRAGASQTQMVTESQATVPGQPAVIRTLWSVMVNLAATSAQDEWHTPWNQAVSKFICLPFSELRAHHLGSLPEKVQQWVLSDRLQSAVQTTSCVTTGEGIMLIPPSTHSASDVGEAIRWKAERQSKPGTNGVLVHRLRIECQVGASPVELTITFAKPYLMVHAATDDSRLRDDFQNRGRELVERLERLGVHVERFSVGPSSDDAMTDD